MSARGRWREVGTPAGPVQAALPPPVVSGTEPSMGTVPALGEHTVRVLTEFGCTAEQIAALREAGTI